MIKFSSLKIAIIFGVILIVFGVGFTGWRILGDGKQPSQLEGNEPLRLVMPTPIPTEEVEPTTKITPMPSPSSTPESEPTPKSQEFDRPKMPEGARSNPSDNVGPGVTIEEDMTIDPFPPQGLRASCLAGGTIDLEWFDADAFVKSFNVYRKGESSEWGLVGDVVPQAKQEWHSFVDKGPRHVDSIYVYAITAVDVYGNESEYSDLVELTEPCIEKKDYKVGT